MCGICGIWGQSDLGTVESMVNAMHHRGPDDRGFFYDPTVSLGMTRLSIIDLSQAAHQPMSNSDKTVWIVYNGETYNFKSERRLLEGKGYHFSSSSDTEVVLCMYEHYGDDFLLRLRGMFALAIYDKRQGAGREKMLLARDQLGIKPLIFARVGKQLVFASELKALLASGLIRPEIDPVALRMLLTYGSVYQPRTMLRGVRMLLPAHRIIIESNRDRIERYWSLGIDRHSDLRNQTYDEILPVMASALEESVKLQLVSDVPVGAFLSGGVDSTFLVGLMTRVAGNRIKTFSIGFEAEGAGLDETDEAACNAQFLGADHTRVVVRGTEVRDHIQHIACSLDQPSVDGVNSYFVSKVACQTVTVAISGTGGDEVFAGYPWFTQMAQFERQTGKDCWSTAARQILTRIACLPIFDSLLFGPCNNVLSGARNGADFVTQYAKNYQIFGVFGAAHLLSPELRSKAQAGRALNHDLKTLDEISMGTAVDRVSALCLRGYTTNQLLRDIDAVSMAHSLEVRVPFLDVPLIDLALSLPTMAKLGEVSGIQAAHEATYKESGSKKILIDVGRKFKLLPENIDQQPKRGFSLPFDAWLKDPLRDVMDDALSARTTNRRGFFRANEVTRIEQDFLEGRIHWSRPWLLMVTELWCRELLDTATTK